MTGDAMTHIHVLHQQGRLSQTCPACGLVEGAGTYCTKCLTKTNEADWFVGPPRGRHAPIRQAQRPETPPSDTQATDPLSLGL